MNVAMAVFSAFCLAFILVTMLAWRPGPARVGSGRLEERRRLERTDPVWGWRKPWLS